VEALLWRGLQLDEAMLYLNLAERSFAGLLAPLDWNQGGPILFLWIEKALVSAFGGSEAVLRLWPELMGTGALILFALWAWRRLRPIEAVAATALLAIGRYPILYTVFAKQYSTDLCVGVALYFLIERVRVTPLSRPAYAAMLFAGAASVWLSHPSVFVIAGVGGTWLVDAALRRDRNVLWRVGLFCGVSATAFLVEYALLLRNLTANQFLLDWWVEGFMPFPVTSLDDLLWFWNRANTVPRMFTTSVTLNMIPLLIVVGAVTLYRRDRMLLGLLFGPFLATLVASAAHKYPVHARLALFLYPALMAVIAVGSVASARFLARWIPAQAAVALLGLALLLPQTISVATALTTPVRDSDDRRLLEAVDARFQAGDCLLVHEEAWPIVAYYREDFAWKGPAGCVVRYRDWARDGRPEFERLKQFPRAWFLFIHHGKAEWLAYLRDHVGVQGRVLESLDTPWGFVQLIETED
jgi:hypothetical protein